MPEPTDDPHRSAHSSADQSNEHPRDRNTSDQSVAAQLRAYADGAEQMLPPTPVAGERDHVGRGPLIALATAAAVVVVIAGAVVLGTNSGNDDRIVTPADGARPENSTEPSPSITAPLPFEQPCPGVALQPQSSVSVDPGFAVAAITTSGFLPYEVLIEGIDANDRIEMEVATPADSDRLGASIIQTLEVAVCAPFSDSITPDPAVVQVLDTARPTIRAYLREGTTPSVVVMRGSPTVTVESLVRAISTLRWEPEPTSVTTTAVPTSDPVLQDAADEAHLISFDSVGQYTLGQKAPSEGPAVYYDSEMECGSWTPLSGPDGSGSPPIDAEIIFGIGGPPTDVRANVLYVRSPAYRTASGVGVGTDLASLQRVYGDRLVVDRADGWENPTDGLLASYKDVAAVMDGDRALTFTLSDDIVTEVKVSRADAWGDDEGCALNLRILLVQ